MPSTFKSTQTVKLIKCVISTTSVAHNHLQLKDIVIARPRQKLHVPTQADAATNSLLLSDLHSAANLSLLSQLDLDSSLRWYPRVLG